MSHNFNYDLVRDLRSSSFAIASQNPDLERMIFRNSQTSAQVDPHSSGSSGPLTTSSENARNPSNSKVLNVRDLEALVKDAPQASFREGLHLKDVKPQFRSAVFFEIIKRTSSSSGPTEVRYLPLQTSEPALSPPPSPQRTPSRLRRWRNETQRSPDASRATAPPNQEQNNPALRVLPSADRHIEQTQARRAMVNVKTTSRTPRLTRAAIRSASSSGAGAVVQWPLGEVPTEIFAMITETLSYRDIRNMRLVNKEFDRKSSPILFKEVVVPFTPQLYDMIEDDVSARFSNLSVLQASTTKIKGKKKADRLQSRRGGPNAYHSQEDSIYYRTSAEDAPRHGLRVFQGFGPHMNKFGIRFEVSETDLLLAPTKRVDYKHVDAYHGEYEWPPPGYARFGRLANLERTADETPRMTAALATLESVREVGLSLDSGLGYLNGPDRSHHELVFDRPLPVFEGANMEQHPRSDGADAFWSALRESHGSFTARGNIAEERLMACILPPNRDMAGKFPNLSVSRYEDTSLWPTVKAEAILAGKDLTGLLTSGKHTAQTRGLLYTTRDHFYTHEGGPHVDSPPLSPNNLTSEQKQWVLETGWAQSAFLDTYILALADNPQVFHQVTKVSISKISSGLLVKLDHKAFWDALPNVMDATLLVSPDWRTFGKDAAGCAETPSIAPSLTVNTFHAVVNRMVLLENLKKLRIGYTDGGEKATGMYGRNSNLMPAPVATLAQLLRAAPDTIFVDHIEDFTLVNCWITPRAIVNLATTQTIVSAPGRSLNFDSVSLTANTQPERPDAFKYDIGTVQEFRESCWPAIIHGFKHLIQPTYPEPASGSAFSTLSEEPIQAPFSKITFNSCGYAILHNVPATTFDQTSLQGGLIGGLPGQLEPEPRFHHMSTWFQLRAEQLRPHMMTSRDECLGRIVSWMSARESAVLTVWRMTVEGLGSEGGEAECDGMPKRGFGRFSGVVKLGEGIFS